MAWGLTVFRVLAVFILALVIGHQVPQHVILGLRRAIKLFPNLLFEIARNGNLLVLIAVRERFLNRLLDTLLTHRTPISIL
jgi:hypothetical protein